MLKDEDEEEAEIGMEKLPLAACTSIRPNLFGVLL